MKLQFTLALLIFSFSLQSFTSETFRGTISKNAEGVVQLKTTDQLFPLLLDEKFKNNMDEVMVNSPDYIFEIEGDLTTEGIKTSRLPRVVGDLLTEKGILTFDQVSQQFFLNDKKAVFGRTKEIYTFSFDDLSKQSYVGKEVITHGHNEIVNGEEVFIINAILEAHLISAEENSLYLPPVEALANPLKFVLNEMPKNEYARSRTPFRLTLNGNDHVPEEGESVLIITLSGRQGEEPGAAGGHFAIGMGEVDKDLSVKGETFNFYFKGPKEVLAGNTDLVSYFGHLIQGQQNYRPTFTIYAYGVDKNKLLKVRDIFEKETHRVRTEPGLSITASYNCTTTSVDALKEIAIFGNQNNLLNSVFDPQSLWFLNPFSWGSRDASGEGTLSKLRQLSYVLKTDREYYMPRNALESFMINFDSKSRRKKMGIKRVDYVFIPQTQSERPVGGMSYDQIGEAQKTIKMKKDLALMDENLISKDDKQKMIDELLLSID